jgi:hypothetical protein
MPMTTGTSVTLTLRIDATQWLSQVAMVAKKLLIGEVEDSMRRQERAGDTGWEAEEWPQVRQAFIDLAAYLILFVRHGDQDAASQAKAQDTGADGGGAAQGA